MDQKEAMGELDRLLDKARYPLADLDVEPFGDDDVEITATLLATSADQRELDRITAALLQRAHVRQAFWNPSTSE